MGLTWICGFVATFSNVMVLWYIFIIFNSLQGVFIFIAFVCNKKVYYLIRGRTRSKTISISSLMAEMEKDADVLGRYRAISNKLKKRFLKRPNVAEGTSLAKSLQQQECHQYAGFCCLAQARCEHTLANAAGEAHALTEAARAFLQAELSNRELKCPKNNHVSLSAALCIELGNALKELNKPGEAMSHFQRAAELQSQSPLDCLQSLGSVASCKIDIKDYDGALGVLTEMAYLAQERGGSSITGKPIGAYCDVLARCEISRVLLLMLLQPTPQRIRPEHAQTLEKYTWETNEDNTTDSANHLHLYQYLLTNVK
ncbi:hypothetical protein KUTeg_004371 [Tegillarca granosa]|uniref:Factor VIII intron 22 protein n=1 Tax=Tegillarca granosa TaxID=220873 RepID=A0ABQ9FPU6_TEGGR|nr:hypothetical protein KUTeg_004371 [Tegillarca granosa]